MFHLLHFLCGMSVLYSGCGYAVNYSFNADHLVVLSHGVMGTAQDLNYLGRLLEDSGCVILKSTSNENLKSLDGFKIGAERLADEIKKCVVANNQLKRISIVGNSLGGLYARYALKLLYNDLENTICGLQPHRFMSIATPHLGVWDWTFVEDNGYKAPDIAKSIVARFMLSTGRDIFGVSKQGEDSLLLLMATDESFLKPLRSFGLRRLYANLNRDLVVPLGTAAFIPKSMVQSLREEFKQTSGIVTMMQTPSSNILSDHFAPENHKNSDMMMQSLDNLGWEKVIVNFPVLLPMAHNMICALSREPKWFYEGLLGFNAGQFVMSDASKWLTESTIL